MKTLIFILMVVLLTIAVPAFSLTPSECVNYDGNSKIGVSFCTDAVTAELGYTSSSSYPAGYVATTDNPVREITLEPDGIKFYIINIGKHTFRIYPCGKVEKQTPQWKEINPNEDMLPVTTPYLTGTIRNSRLR